MNFLKIDSLPHGWQVLAVILLSGGVTALAYGLTEAGLAELASSCLSFYGFFVGSRVMAKIASSRQAQHFKETQEIIGTIWGELQAWLTDRQLLALAIIGVPVTVVFVTVKALISAGLMAFSSVWFAVAAGLIVASFVASPLLFKGLREAVFHEAVSADAGQPGDRTESARPRSGLRGLRGGAEGDDAR